MPITCGLAAIAKSIDDTLTQQEIIDLFYSSSYKKINGMNFILNPLGFVCSVLNKVNRTEEANVMLSEAEERESYSYAIINSNNMTTKDLKSINQYLATITNTKFYYFDTKTLTNISDIYTILQSNNKERKGKLSGILIFGDSDAIPSFDIKYKLDTVLEGIEDGNYMKTDFFFGNLDNSIENIIKFNIYDYYYGNRGVDLIPKCKVARLTLNKGYFAPYFEKYNKFLLSKHGTNPYICSFSNPVSPYTYKDKGWKDDLNVLVKNCAEEFDIIDDNYRMFGNLQGDYIGDTKVEGDFIPENLTLTNKQDSYEYMIYTHGQENNIDRTIFDGDNGKRISLINSETINTILSDNYYYFDSLTCTNGAQLRNNIIETALMGNCVGAFAASCDLSWGAEKGTIKYFGSKNASDLEDCGFYYFIYEYLYNLSKGYSRSDSFFKAKQSSLIKMISLQDEKSYKMIFNLNTSNNIFYQNFGIFETNFIGNLLTNTISTLKYEDDTTGDSIVNYSGGKTIGEAIKIYFKKGQSTSINLTINNSNFQLLDNNYVRFTIALNNEEKNVYFTVFGGGDSNNFNGLFSILIDEAKNICFDVSKDDINKYQEFIVLFNINNKDENRCFYSLNDNSLSLLRKSIS